MTNLEFSNSFDVLLNSFNGGDVDIKLDEYEKSVFLTKAQEEVAVNLYNGKNIYGDSFESTEEIRRYLNELVRTKEYKVSEAVSEKMVLSNHSTVFDLDDEVAFITLEQVTYSADSDLKDCFINGDYNHVTVYPVTHDEWANIKDNPFRGPTKYKAVRIDYGDSDNLVEIISKYPISTYLIKYLSKPKPIILINLPDNLSINGISKATPCELNPLLHNTILERAVKLAILSKTNLLNKG